MSGPFPVIVDKTATALLLIPLLPSHPVIVFMMFTMGIAESMVTYPDQLSY